MNNSMSSNSSNSSSLPTRAKRTVDRRRNIVPLDDPFAHNASVNQTRNDTACLDWSAEEVEEEDSSNERIHAVQIPNSAFLHVGKAGGGTVEDQMRKQKINFDLVCHPEPCLDTMSADKIERALILIRDPVDRFKSAFYWRKKLACRKEGETRIRAVCAPDHPDRACRALGSREYRVIFDLASGDANQLAEHMCEVNQSWKEYNALEAEMAKATAALRARAKQLKQDGGSTGDDDETRKIRKWRKSVRQQRTAKFDELSKPVQSIHHMKNDLRKWLPTNSTSELVVDVIAIVLEPGFDFVYQVDGALEYLKQSGSDNDITEPVIRERREAIAEDEQHRPWRHSSGKTASISELGVCCLTQNMADDYKILMGLSESVCKGPQANLCRDAISSILNRRKKYLEEGYNCAEHHHQIG